jgi:hypothetical protein
MQSERLTGVGPRPSLPFMAASAVTSYPGMVVEPNFTQQRVFSFAFTFNCPLVHGPRQYGSTWSGYLQEVERLNGVSDRPVSRLAIRPTVHSTGAYITFQENMGDLFQSSHSSLVGLSAFDHQTQPFLFTPSSSRCPSLQWFLPKVPLSPCVSSSSGFANLIVT